MACLSPSFFFFFKYMKHGNVNYRVPIVFCRMKIPTAENHVREMSHSLYKYGLHHIQLQATTPNLMLYSSSLSWSRNLHNELQEEILTPIFRSSVEFNLPTGTPRSQARNIWNGVKFSSSWSYFCFTSIKLPNNRRQKSQESIKV